MGVLTCGREDCGNIMCDRYSSQHGYICRECFEELVAGGVATDVSNFMESEKPGHNPIDASEAYFDRIFPDRSER